MGMVTRMIAGEGRAPWDDYWYQARGAASMAGVEVSVDLAMKVGAFYTCVAIIAEDSATIPLPIYEQIGENDRKVARNHPLYDLLHDQPNDIQTASDFREMMVAFAMLRGRGIAEKIRGPRGPVDQLVPLHPDLVRPAGGRWAYRDPKLNYQERFLLPDEVFIVRGRFGRSILEFASETVGLGIALDQHEAQFIGRGARVQSVVTHPRSLSDPARANITKELDKHTAKGERAGRPMLLEEGLTWTSVQMTNEDAQFLESKIDNRRQIYGFFRMPPPKAGDLERATFGNIEELEIQYVTDTLRPWCVRIEQCVSRDLILARGRFFAEHTLEGLLRGDIQTRYAAHAIGIQWGFLSPNEARSKENLNRVDGLDYHLAPLNMTKTDEGKTTVNFAPTKQGGASAYLTLLARDQAARAVRREVAAVATLAERTGGSGSAWTEGLAVLYAGQRDFLAEVLRAEASTFDRYCSDHRAQLVSEGPTAADWGRAEGDALAELVIDRAASMPAVA